MSDNPFTVSIDLHREDLLQILLVADRLAQVYREQAHELIDGEDEIADRVEELDELKQRLFDTFAAAFQDEAEKRFQMLFSGGFEKLKAAHNFMETQGFSSPAAAEVASDLGAYLRSFGLEAKAL